MRFAANKTKDEQGSTLLIAVAILGLLFFFALVFARLVRFERIASQNYTDSVRARLVARAGVQRAIQEMQQIARKRHYSHPMEDGWGFALVGGSDLATAGVPLDVHSTLIPSFRIEDPRFQMYGDNLVYSGQLGSTYGDRSLDVYKLKILDCASMVNVNHPDHISARRMLKNLLRASFPRYNDARARTAANRVLDGRPEGGFKSKAEVHALLTNQLGATSTAADLLDEEWPLLADMITVYGWTDSSTVRPYARNSNGTDLTNQFGPGLIAEAPRRQLLPESRAPINLNTAMFPVLVSLFAETKAASDRMGPGRFVEITYNNAVTIAREIIRYRNEYGPFRTWREFEGFIDGKNPDNRPQSDGSAGAPTGFNMGGTGAWGPAALYDPGLSGGLGLGQAEIPQPGANTSEYGGAGGLLTRALVNRRQGHRDLIKAICNPNTMVSKFGMLPTHGGGYATVSGNDIQIPRLLDKSDIINGTTDASFDSMGMFEITSVGMVLVEDEVPVNGMKILASSSQQAVVQVYEVFRLTTQQDFESNRAYMATGNWVEAVEFQGWDRYDNFGLNKEAYGPTPSNANGYQGWPGVLSGPNYSFDRLGIAQAYAMRDGYVPALWDGHLMLTNLSGYSVQNEDFLVGFARGGYEAFKVRAWWEPVDQDNNGVYLNLDAPTHPNNDYLIEKRANPSTTPADWISSGGEMSDLANPMNDPNMLPRREAGAMGPGNVWTPLGEEGVLAETPDSTIYTDASQMFYEGSAMWNTGMAIHGRRGFTDTANGNHLKPQFLAYSGDNLDLTRGCSIRFWVQPLVDPFMREEEVLFSWVGSNGGTTGPARASLGDSWFDYNLDGDKDPEEVQDSDARAVGIRVVKKAIGSDVLIELQAVPNDNGQGVLPESWAFVSTGFSNQAYVRIDVTPQNGGYNALQPEWLPGTWHWIVVNFGPDGGGDHTATLQVDMDQSWVNQTYGRLFITGNTQPSNPIQGEFHGYGGVTGPGPEYRVSLSQSTGAGANSVVWGSPQLLGDWYHCDAGSGSTVNSESQSFTDAVQYDSVGGNYVATSNWPTPAPWESDPNQPTFDHEIILRYRRNAETSFDPDPDGDPATDDGAWDPPYVPEFDNPEYDPGDPNAPQSGGGGGSPTADPPGAAPMTQTPPGGGPGPAVTTGATTWYHTFSGDELGGDGGAGGHEWRIDVEFRWKTSNAPIGTDCTTDPDGSGPARACCATCKHDSQGTRKSGYGVPASSTAYWCYLVHNNVLGGDVASPNFRHQGAQAPNPVPLDRTCDDCHGCERCDVDGPMFFGGEPGDPDENQNNLRQQHLRRGITNLAGGSAGSGTGTGNYTYSRGNYGGTSGIDTVAASGSGYAAPDGINPNTSAYAVFDNIVVRNTKENRTDYNGGGAAPVDFEDRFWETNMAYWTGAGSPGFGAVYHRALLEMIGTAGTLGTVTWTSYRSAERLDFEVALWDIPAALTGYSGGALFNMDNKDLTSSGDSYTPAFGGVYSEVPRYGADGDALIPGDGVVDGFSDNPIGGSAHQGTIENGFYTEGIVLGTPQTNLRYDGLGQVTASGTTEPHLLVLGVRLAGLPSPTDIWTQGGVGFDPRTTPPYDNQNDANGNGIADGVEALSAALASGTVVANLNGGRNKANSALPGGGNLPAIPGAGATAIPQPLLGSPIFEDFTLTLILDKPVTFFAEEGGMTGEFNTTVNTFYTGTGTEPNPATGLASPAGTQNTPTTVNLADGSVYTINNGVVTGSVLTTIITSYNPVLPGFAGLPPSLPPFVPLP